MLLNGLRKELADLFRNAGTSRMPAVRRSLRTEWLYATDLPSLCSGRIPDELLDRLSEAGWEYEEETGWLQLRKKSEEPPERWYGGNFGPEAACCLSLLKRHAPAAGPGEEAQRTLIKAAESGSESYENACADLHREWAARLRRKEPLPAVSLKYFGE